MKKLLYILLLLTLQVSAQPVTSVGLPTGTSSFTPTFRNGAYQGFTMPWWYIGGKWYLGMTAEFAGQAYAPISGSLKYLQIVNFGGNRNLTEVQNNTAGYFDADVINFPGNKLINFPVDAVHYDYLRIGDNGRGFVLASLFDGDALFFRRSKDNVWGGWRRFAFIDEVPANIDAYTKTESNARYKPIGYTPSQSEVNTAIGYVPYNSSNPNGYVNASALAPYAPLASPAFTGTPTVPTASGSNANQVVNYSNLTSAIAANSRSSVQVNNNLTMALNTDYLSLSDTQYGLTLPPCDAFTTSGSKIITVLAIGSGGVKILVPVEYFLYTPAGLASAGGDGYATLTQNQKVQLIPVGANKYYLQPLNGTITVN